MYAPRNLSGQGPLQWESNNAFPPRQEYGASAAYGESRSTRAQRPNTHSDMVPLPPQSDMYPPQDPYRYPPEHMAFSQPAPRQRTAIACNYCRRRKIRCSGFESSHDGRCSNCQRFNQECIFTPVSSQAQAFVPAHAAYPHLRNGGMPGRGRAVYPQNPLLYGAHGQPLEAMPQGAYGQDPHEYRLPNPPGAHLSGPAGPYTRSYDDPPYEQSYRKRPHTKPHVPVLPPPLPGSSSQAGPFPPSMQGRRGSAENPYSDPPAPSFAPSSPASSSTSYKSAYSQQPPTSQSQFYPTQTSVTPRRSSPTSSYSYSSMERTSASPHAQGPPPGAYQFPSTATLHPPLVIPSQQSRTPPPPPPPQSQPPSATSQQRPGMSIQNILDQGSGQSQSSRSATDNSMLDALMPRKF